MVLKPFLDAVVPKDMLALGQPHGRLVQTFRVLHAEFVVTDCTSWENISKGTNIADSSKLAHFDPLHLDLLSLPSRTTL